MLALLSCGMDCSSEDVAVNVSVAKVGMGEGAVVYVDVGAMRVEMGVR